MNYPIGAEVVVLYHERMPKYLVGQFGLVVGVVGLTHCLGRQVYSVELDVDKVCSLCACMLSPCAHYKTKTQWRHCVWQPKRTA